MNISAQENIYILFLENQIQPIEKMMNVNEETAREKERMISCAPGKLISVMNISSHLAYRRICIELIKFSSSRFDKL